MKLASRLDTAKPSPIGAVVAKVKELKSQGINVYDLTVGEPSFNTPDFVKDGAINAIHNNKTKYTIMDGTVELRKAVAEKFKKDNQLDYNYTEVIITCGAKQSIFNAMAASLNEGDEVILIAPYWTSYPDIVLIFGGRPVFINTTIENNFKATVDQISNAITDKTKWIFFNAPSNPTGTCYTKDELIEIGKVLKKHEHVNILVDDIYEYICYDEAKFYTLPQVCPNLLDRTVLINGASKSFAMTGWRIGFAATKDKTLMKGMSLLQSQSTAGACSISQEAALTALTGDREFLTEWTKEYQEKRDYCCEKLNEINGVECKVPQGAFYVFPCIKKILGCKTKSGKIIKTSEDFVIALLEDENVAVVHGEAFGADGYFRISFATDMQTIKGGMAKIAKFITELSIV